MVITHSTGNFYLDYQGCNRIIREEKYRTFWFVPHYHHNQFSVIHYQMTNGGGASEEDRSKRLTKQLGFEVGRMIPLILHSWCPQDQYLQLYASAHPFTVRCT